MSESKHTPGPWSVEGGGSNALVRGRDGEIVAVRHRLRGERHEANARLIASAPELLTALIDALSWADGGHTDDKTWCVCDRCEVVRAAHDVIEKAGGRR